MHIHLLHNSKAGLATPQVEHLLQQITSAGHRVTPLALSLPDHTPGERCDMIAVAGGDGTIENIVRRFYKDKANIQLPLFIIPQGTANNIAKSLCISGDLPTCLGILKTTEPISRPGAKLAVGQLVSPDFDQLFVESVGCGLLTRLISFNNQYPGTRGITDNGDADILRRQVRHLAEILSTLEASDYHIKIDGRNFSGRYLMVEIMNIARVGPGIELAPRKDASSATFQVILVNGNQRERLMQYLLALAKGARVSCPFTRIVGREVTLCCQQMDVHVDDKILDGDQWADFTVKAGVHHVNIANESAADDVENAKEGRTSEA